MLVGQPGRFRLQFPGQQALLVAGSEDIGQASFDVFLLGAPERVVVAVQRFRVDALEEKGRAALFLRVALRRAADGGQSAPDKRRIEFVDESQAVTLVRAEGQQGDRLVRIGRRFALRIDRPAGAEFLALAGELLHAPHRHGRGGPVDHDGKAHRVLRGESPGMRVGAHRRCLPAEGYDLGGGRGTIGVSNVALERSVDHVASTPEIMRGVVHAHHTNAVLVGQLHAAFHRAIGHRLAELVVSVPRLGGGETRRKFFDLRAGSPTPDLAPEQIVEMKRLQCIMRADAVARGAVAEPRRIARLVRGIPARQIGPRDQVVMLFRRNNEPSLGHD